MSDVILDDPTFDAQRLRSWLLQAGFSPAAPSAEGEARWVKYPGDGRAGLPAAAVEVRLSRGEGGHLRLAFTDVQGQPVEVERRAFEPTGPVTAFVDRHYRHYNAGVVGRAARAFRAHVESGRKMLVSLAGAMSTAELGISLAEMIRKGKVHAISCTGANLEEDIFILVGREDYRHVQWRALPAEAEQALLDEGLNRVTDVCIPESVMDAVIDLLQPLWAAAIASDAPPRLAPDWLAEALKLLFIERPELVARRKDSWVCAAIDAGLPIYVPGWADSTLGNALAAWCIREGVAPHRLLLSDADAMVDLVRWYRRDDNQQCGFFQIGGGIAGDFAICAVPLVTQDLKEHTEPWGYFCQISDAVTSYGGYSGAPPNEKITWGKITPETPRFAIQSDATIVAPLIFGYVLGW